MSRVINRLTECESYEELREYVLSNEWSSSQVSSRIISYRDGILILKKESTKVKWEKVVLWLTDFNKEFSKRKDTSEIKVKVLALYKEGHSVINIQSLLDNVVSRQTIYNYVRGV